MPRFFFDLYNGPSVNRDDEGTEFDSAEDAEAAAMKTVAHMIVDGLVPIADASLLIEVLNGKREHVFSAHAALNGVRVVS
jgi:hypothetical protein